MLFVLQKTIAEVLCMNVLRGRASKPAIAGFQALADATAGGNASRLLRFAVLMMAMKIYNGSAACVATINELGPEFIPDFAPLVLSRDLLAELSGNIDDDILAALVEAEAGQFRESVAA